MKKTFKFLAFVLVCMLLLLSVACGDNEKDTAPSAVPTAAESAVPTEVPTSEPTQTPADNTPTPEAKPTVKPGQLTYAGGILSEEAPQEPIMLCDTTATPNHLQIVEDLAIQFFPSTSFTEVAICCPSYNDNVGTLTFALYAWMGSYESTLAGEAIKTQTFENYNDNALLGLKFEEALPDGEYILLLTTPKASDGVGTWGKIGNFEGQKVYVDGGETLDENSSFHVELRVTYINTPNNLYGKLS
ncbi:MAG: hypothetical protein E7387_07670 [Ruminococcaceae bacterium]|nr:hypothetical protein [Oscillospiraceae bacterium]